MYVMMTRRFKFTKQRLASDSWTESNDIEKDVPSECKWYYNKSLTNFHKTRLKRLERAKFYIVLANVFFFRLLSYYIFYLSIVFKVVGVHASFP